MTTTNAAGAARLWPWLVFVLFPVAVLIFISLERNPVWFTADSPLLYQAFIPLGTLAMVWRRRDELKTTLTELKTLFPEENHPKRCGNELLIFIGGVVMLSGMLASLLTISIVGFILLCAGIIYYFWGPFLLRSLVGPLSFLLLMLLPPPISGLAASLNLFFLQRGVAFAGYVFRALGQRPQIQGSTLSFPQQIPVVVPPGASTLPLLLATLAFTIWLLVVHRPRLPVAFLLVFLACVLSQLIGAGRIVLMATLRQEQPLPLWLCLPPLWLLLGGIERWLRPRFVAEGI